MLDAVNGFVPLTDGLCHCSDSELLMFIVKLSVLIRSEFLSPCRESDAHRAHQRKVVVITLNVLVSCLCHTLLFKLTMQRYEEKSNHYIFA